MAKTNIVVIDESCYDLGIGKPIAPVKSFDLLQHNTFRRISTLPDQILPAYTLDGVLYSEVYEGSTITEV